MSTTGSLYRVIEFGQGFEGYLASHEVYFYVLEAVPMMPPFILFNIFHPGRVVPGGFTKPTGKGILDAFKKSHGNRGAEKPYPTKLVAMEPLHSGER